MIQMNKLLLSCIFLHREEKKRYVTKNFLFISKLIPYLIWTTYGVNKYNTMFIFYLYKLVTIAKKSKILNYLMDI